MAKTNFDKLKYTIIQTIQKRKHSKTYSAHLICIKKDQSDQQWNHIHSLHRPHLTVWGYFRGVFYHISDVCFISDS